MMLEKTGFDAPPAYPSEEAQVNGHPVKDSQSQSKDAPSATSPLAGDLPAPYTEDEEQRFRNLAVQLREAIDAYKTARSQNRDEETMKRNQENVLRLMSEVADAAPDPKVKAHYKDKATKFLKASSTKEKDRVLHEIGKGLIIILSAPFAIAAAALYTTAGILQGTGHLLKEVALLHPKMRKWLKKRKDAEWDME
ncbi:hypothetical protein BDP27DRAFT_1316345 [Rhodocollybia butyracea]|uniref:Transmembrane protein n=1 Tax=Rhodocollybia butyracea TaxID=206335 RepID=A0A9P5UE86_9AGAR|nr:hypothetical protein BDP27DRAFT_1316345 [Rhodocollybia butyracea]